MIKILSQNYMNENITKTLLLKILEQKTTHGIKLKFICELDINLQFLFNQENYMNEVYHWMQT